MRGHGGFRKVLALAGVLALVPLLAMTAAIADHDGDQLRTSYNAELNVNQRGITFAEKLAENPNEGCPAPSSEQGPYAWHFIAPAQAPFEELNVDFEKFGDELDVDEVSDPDERHAYVYTDEANDTLIDATATVDTTGMKKQPAEDEILKFQLSHVCDFSTSAEPEPEPEDEVVDEEPETGEVVVQKLVVGDPGDLTFEFELDDGDVHQFGLDDGDEETVEDVSAGQVTLTETERHGADDVTIECSDGTTGSSPLSFVLDPDETVRCTVTNTFETPNVQDDEIEDEEPETGTLIVEKEIDGDVDDSPEFSFSVAADQQNDRVFTLEDNGEEVFDDLDPAIYTVTETDPGGATDTAVVCVNEDTETEIAGDDTVAVELAAGDTVRCTFTNTYEPEVVTVPVIPAIPVVEPEPSSLTITKAVTGDAPEKWAFGFDGTLSTFNLDEDDPSKTFGRLDADSYSITEADSVAVLDDVTCVDNDEDASQEPEFTVNERTVTVTLAEGQDITCTFTNRYVTEVLSEVVIIGPDSVERNAAPQPGGPEQPAASPVADGPTTEVLGSTVAGGSLPQTGGDQRSLAIGVLGLLTVIGLGAARRALTRP